ncbi:MAG: TonB family protein [Kiritimatiellae bacterium]|nr:TonB family protein [Kiritimatiellia bacterium]
MQTKFPTLNIGLLFGIAVSLLLHGSLLSMKATHRPATPQFESGVVSVELTLLPSIAAVAATDPSPLTPAPPEEFPKPRSEETPVISAREDPTETESETTPEPTPAEPEVKRPAPTPTPNVNAVDLDGAPEEDKGALTEAEPKSECRPVYPRVSRRRGEEGVVVASVDVDVSGRGSNPHLVRSSGHTRLDRAALKALENAHFTPASRRGHPYASTLTQTFTFRLTDD